MRTDVKKCKRYKIVQKAKAGRLMGGSECLLARKDFFSFFSSICRKVFPGKFINNKVEVDYIINDDEVTFSHCFTVTCLTLCQLPTQRQPTIMYENL